MSERLIIEIGVGRADSEGYWQATALTRQFANDEQYVGLDIGAHGSFTGSSDDDPSRIDSEMRQDWLRIKARRPDADINFIQADAQALPFADGSVDEVIANNVFGYGAADTILAGMFKESYRVLKHEGTMVMHDDHTPRFIGRASLMNWFEEFGLPEMWMDYASSSERAVRYAKTAERYGFPDRFAVIRQSMPEVASELSSLNTLWILTKGQS